MECECCLECCPERIDLLFDLAFFHEFENILPLLIELFIRACEEQEDLEAFTKLAQEFYYTTHPDGYEALYALRDLFPQGTEKRKIIDFLIAEEEEVERMASQPFNFRSDRPLARHHH